MIYLDNGATSFPKPVSVKKAMCDALLHCTNPGRGGYALSEEAAWRVYRCRECVGAFFGCEPEQAVFTANCTHGLNLAIHTLAKPGGKVVVSGWEHNAVMRPLHLLGAKIIVAGRKLFDWDDTLESFEQALKQGVSAAVFTHVSNVFGYILPVAEMAALCRQYSVPFILDAAQSAGVLPISMKELGADFIAMPGHKGLLGPMGTGILLCKKTPYPLLAGGTGSESARFQMPSFLPDGAEAGTLNVPGIAGLHAGLLYLQKAGLDRVFLSEHKAMRACCQMLQQLGFLVFSAEHQAGTLSFLPKIDCEEAAQKLAKQDVAVRAGLHCAPLAHESAGTLSTGTVRVSFGIDASMEQIAAFRQAIMNCGGL